MTRITNNAWILNKPCLRIVSIVLLGCRVHCFSFQVHLLMIVHWEENKQRRSTIISFVSLPLFEFDDRGILLLDNSLEFLDQLFTVPRSNIVRVEEEKLSIVVQSEFRMKSKTVDNSNKNEKKLSFRIDFYLGSSREFVGIEVPPVVVIKSKSFRRISFVECLCRSLTLIIAVFSSRRPDNCPSFDFS